MSPKAMRRRPWISCLAAAAMLPACAAPRAPDAAGIPPAPTPDRAYDVEHGRFIAFERLVERVARADVILFGERHDDPATHRAQLALLRALAAHRDRIVLSLEMFERDVQPALDRYLAGRIPEAEFLALARPWSNYAADYRPLVELAKARGWSVVAANVPRRIANRIARSGLAGLDSLPAAERAFAARDIACPRNAYYDRFLEAMGAHPGPTGLDPSAAGRYFQAQCVKDETMAESIAEALAMQPGAVVVHVTGAFHVEYGQGTTARVERRLPGARIDVISAVPVEEPDRVHADEHAERADYLLFTPARRRDARR